MAGSEELDEAALRLEALSLSLRTDRGVNLDRFADSFGLALDREPRGLLDLLIRQGWVKVIGGCMVPTVEGMLRVDALPLLWP